MLKKKKKDMKERNFEKQGITPFVRIFRVAACYISPNLFRAIIDNYIHNPSSSAVSAYEILIF